MDSENVKKLYFCLQLSYGHGKWRQVLFVCNHSNKSACTHFPSSAMEQRDSYRRNISFLFPYFLIATNTSLKRSNYFELCSLIKCLLKHSVAKILFGKSCQVVKKVVWHNENGTLLSSGVYFLYLWDSYTCNERHHNGHPCF